MSDAFIEIDRDDTTPAYQQIVDGLRALLVRGELPPGRRLPPVRQLAADLTVHHNTVAEAYRILAAEGWLELRQGRGAVVVERTAVQAGAEDEIWLRSRLRELIIQATGRGMKADRIEAILMDVLGDQRHPAQKKETKDE